MFRRKSVRVTQDTDSGRNERFRDTERSRSMNRAEFVRLIKEGSYPGYYIRVINGVETPVSNPDRSEGNNLG